RGEPDRPVFLKGLSEGVLSGEAVAEIANTNVKSGDYAELYGKPRPSHADYVSYVKYGTLDFSGGGAFSGRLTAPFCVAGGIAKQALAARSHVLATQAAGGVEGKSYRDSWFRPRDKAFRGGALSRCPAAGNARR
ncbi:MAG: chorismate synthase, partial [Christensenellaceae bacterium]